MTVPHAPSATLHGALFQLDGLALVTTGLTLFVGAIVAVAAQRTLRADPARRRFAVLLTLALAGSLGMVLSATLIGIALGWMVAGQALVRLVALAPDWAEARAVRQRTERLFALGDGALVLAVVVLGLGTGEWGLAPALAAVTAPDAPLWLPTTVAALALVAALVRCAQPPFSSWLLSSLTAPTPVSALMHAGLVNAGGVLLLRLAPVLEAAPGVRLACLAAGLAGVLWGWGVMQVRPDVKRALAASTVAQLGFMLVALGLGAWAAALWHLVAHGLFKAWLFLGAGSTVGRPARAQGLTGAARSMVLFAPIMALGGAWLIAGPTATLLPTALTLAAGLVMLASLSAASGGLLTLKLPLTALVALLGGLQAAGLALMHAAVGADAPLPLPAEPVVIVTLALIGGWLWQALAPARPLPGWLHVWLLNAGNLPLAVSLK